MDLPQFDPRDHLTIDEHALAAPAPTGAVLIRTRDVGIQILNVHSFPDEWRFTLQVVCRISGLADLYAPGEEGDRPDPAGLQIDFTFDDGETVAVRDDWFSDHARTVQTQAYRVEAIEGSSSSLASASAYRCSPLPPPGTIRVGCQWDALGVPLTISELDADAIIAAARESEILWPTSDVEGDLEGGGSVWVSVRESETDASLSANDHRTND